MGILKTLIYYWVHEFTPSTGLNLWKLRSPSHRVNTCLSTHDHPNYPHQNYPPPEIMGYYRVIRHHCPLTRHHWICAFLIGAVRTATINHPQTVTGFCPSTLPRDQCTPSPAAAPLFSKPMASLYLQLLGIKKRRGWCDPGSSLKNVAVVWLKPFSCIRHIKLCIRAWYDVGKRYSIKIKWDFTNGPLSKLLELLDTHV